MPKSCTAPRHVKAQPFFALVCSALATAEAPVDENALPAAESAASLDGIQINTISSGTVLARNVKSVAQNLTYVVASSRSFASNPAMKLHKMVDEAAREYVVNNRPVDMEQLAACAMDSDFKLMCPVKSDLSSILEKELDEKHQEFIAGDVAQRLQGIHRNLKNIMKLDAELGKKLLSSIKTLPALSMFSAAFDEAQFEDKFEIRPFGAQHMKAAKTEAVDQDTS